MRYSTRVVLQIEEEIGKYTVLAKDSHESEACDLCCGPSSQETNEAASAQNLSSTMASDFGSRFQNQSDVLSQLQSSLSPILAAGPSQTGFSGSETAALNTQAINSAGAANRSAQQAAANFGAGQGGGGTSGVQSGITKQIQGAIAGQSAGQLAGAQNNIVQQNYAQGSQNYWKAQGAMNELAAGEDATQFGNLANSSQSNAFGEANTVSQQQNQEEASIAGGITGLASNVLLPGVAGAINAAPGQSAMSGFFGAL